MNKKIFISYAKEDFKIAEKIYNDLQSAGINAWIDFNDLIPGQDWKAKIRQVIADSSFFLLLLSSKSVSKTGFVQKEQKIALNLFDNYPTDQVFIIPVRLDECNPVDEKLKNLHWIDFFPAYRKGIKKLIPALRKLINNAENESIEKADNKTYQSDIIQWAAQFSWLKMTGVTGLTLAVLFLLSVRLPDSRIFSQSSEEISISETDLQSIHRRLNNAGFAAIPYDQKNMEQFSEAIRNFQQSAKIDSSGKLDAETWEKIKLLYDPIENKEIQKKQDYARYICRDS